MTPKETAETRRAHNDIPVTGAGESQQDVVPATSHNLMHTPIASSNVSSESQYATQSAIGSEEGGDNAEIKDVGSTAMGTRLEMISPLT